MDCKNCFYRRGLCRGTLFQMLEKDVFQAKSALNCFLFNHQKDFIVALQVVKNIAEAGNLKYQKLYFEMENHLYEISALYEQNLKKEHEKEQIFLSFLRHGPQEAKKILKEIFEKYRELIFEAEQIIVSKINEFDETYLEVYNYFQELMGEVEIKDLEMLYEVSDCHDPGKTN